MILSAKALSLYSPSKAKLFSGFPSGTCRCGTTWVSSMWRVNLRLFLIFYFYFKKNFQAFYLNFFFESLNFFFRWKKNKIRKNLPRLELTSSLSWSASSSLTSMQMTFQSVSPSSIMAKLPRALTWMTSPRAGTRLPISQTSIDRRHHP